MARPGVDFPGVGCGLVIQRADGRVLLCKRLKAPEAEHWNIVGGKVDQGERSADAARREAEEESGLTIGAVDFLCWTEEIMATDGQHWVSLMYVTRDFAGEPRLTEPDKLSDIGWFALDALPQPLSVFAVKAFAALEARGSEDGLQTSVTLGLVPRAYLSAAPRLYLGSVSLLHRLRPHSALALGTSPRVTGMGLQATLLIRRSVFPHGRGVPRQ